MKGPEPDYEPMRKISSQSPGAQVRSARIRHNKRGANFQSQINLVNLANDKKGEPSKMKKLSKNASELEVVSGIMQIEA